MSARKLIFVGGIHGVGKTQLCKELCALLNIKHVNAGELIRHSKREIATTEKSVANVDQNQELLVAALDAYFKNHSFCLLDGHFCLLKRDGNIEQIPDVVFQQINPLAVVVLRDDPDVIKERLEARDKAQYDGKLLQDLQRNEIDHAMTVCRTYNFPIIIKNPHVMHERAALIAFVKAWISA